MSSILEEIKKNLLNSNIKLSDILNKIYMHSDELGLSKEDLEFIKNEKDGYLDSEAEPTYRFLKGNLKVKVFDSWVDFNWSGLGEETRSQVCDAYMLNPVSSIENIAYNKGRYAMWPLDEDYKSALKITSRAEIALEKEFLRILLMQIKAKVTDIIKKLEYKEVENKINHTPKKLIELIIKGENATTEFKETLSLNLKTLKKDKEIAKSVLKNVVGMLNVQGGVILVGISDSGDIKGIENEQSKLNLSDDRYLLKLKDLIKTKIGEEYFKFIDYEICDLEGNKILVISCNKSNIPAYYDEKEFYIRVNPSAELLSTKKAVEYIKDNFK